MLLKKPFHEKLKTLLLTVAGGLTLAGCILDAETEEVAKLARTQAECRALIDATKDEKLTCMREAKAARQAEIADKKETLAKLKQKEKELSNEFQQIAREEFEKETIPQN